MWRFISLQAIRTIHTNYGMLLPDPDTIVTCELRKQIIDAMKDSEICS